MNVKQNLANGIINIKNKHSCRQIPLDKNQGFHKTSGLGTKKTFMIWSNEVCYDISVKPMSGISYIENQHCTAMQCSWYAYAARNIYNLHQSLSLVGSLKDIRSSMFFQFCPPTPPLPIPLPPSALTGNNDTPRFGTGGSSSQRMLQEPMDVSPGRRRGNSSWDIACDRCGTSKCWIYVVFYDLTVFYMAWYCFYMFLRRSKISCRNDSHIYNRVTV